MRDFITNVKHVSRLVWPCPGCRPPAPAWPLGEIYQTIMRREWSLRREVLPASAINLGAVLVSSC